MLISRIPLVVSLVIAASQTAMAQDHSLHRPVIAPDAESFIIMVSGPDTAGDWELFEAQLDTLQVRRLTKHEGWDGYAVYSPDGRSIIFDRSLDGVPDAKAPHHMALESTFVKPVPEAPEGWTSVSDWHGSDLLAFWEKDGQRDLYIMGTNGTNLRQLTHTSSESEHDAHFSPDGALVAFASGAAGGGGKTTLELIDLPSEKRTILRQSDGRIYGVSWSPDGQRIAFTDTPGGDDDDADIFVYDRGTGDITACTSHESWDHMPVWLPDNTTLLFTSYRSGKERLYATTCGPEVRELVLKP